MKKNVDTLSNQKPFQIKNFMKQVVKTITSIDISQFGGSLAYFFLLSIFPFFIFLNALLGYFNLDISNIIEKVSNFVPNNVVNLLESYLHAVVNKQSSGLLSFGLLVTIFTASKAVSSLIVILNRAYKVKETRSFFKTKALSIMFTILLGFAILTMLFLPAMGEEMMSWIVNLFNIQYDFVNLWLILRWIIGLVILLFTIALLYYIVPNRRNKFIYQLPGTIFTTIFWILLSFGFAVYVNNFGNYNAVYGSLGAVIVLMIWLYLTGIIIIIGGVINHTFFEQLFDKDESHQSKQDDPNQRSNDAMEARFSALKENLSEWENEES